jgi:hypothetical protein
MQELVGLVEVGAGEVGGEDDERTVVLAQDVRVTKAHRAGGRLDDGVVLVQRRPVETVLAHGQVQAIVGRLLRR